MLSYHGKQMYRISQRAFIMHFLIRRFSQKQHRLCCCVIPQMTGVSEKTKENSWHKWMKDCKWSALTLQCSPPPPHPLLFGEGLIHEVSEVIERFRDECTSSSWSAECQDPPPIHPCSLPFPTLSPLDPRCGAAEPPRPLDPQPVHSSIHH